MKFLTYSFISAIFFLSLALPLQACDDEIIDPASLYDGYEFEAEDD